MPNSDRGAAITTADRRIKAVELRAAGETYREIGAQLGVTHTTARKDVRVALAALHADLKAEAAELFALEWERLEMPVPALAKAVKAGNVATVLAWIKLSESRRKLAGLDGPIKVAETDADGNTRNDGALLAALLRAAGQIAAEETAGGDASGAAGAPGDSGGAAPAPAVDSPAGSANAGV